MTWSCLSLPYKLLYKISFWVYYKQAKKKVGSVTNTAEQRIAIFEILTDREGIVLYDEMMTRLKRLGHDTISAQEFDLWCRFYYPVVNNTPFLYNGIVLEGRGLSWLARRLREQRQRKVLS